MSVDDELSAIKSLNDSEERNRSPVANYAKDAIAAIGVVVPPLGAALGVIANALDRREASNREELVSALLKKVREHSGILARLTAQSEEHARFSKEEFPGLVVEGLRRAESVRSIKRIQRFAAVLASSLQVGPRDGADFVEEMLRIANELSDVDVKVLSLASEAFSKQREMGTQEADTVLAARAWTTMTTGITGDELASVGEKLQSFGLVTRIQGHTGDFNSYRPLERGWRFIEYVRDRG